MPHSQLSASLHPHRSGVTADCPSCGYRGAFTASERDGKQLFHCHAGCTQGDLLTAIRSHNPLPTLSRAVAPKQTNTNKLDYIRHLWRENLAAAGTPVEIYLAARGLTGPIPSRLRFLPDHLHKPTGTRWPIMLAAVTDIQGRLQAIHRTYLARDGKGKAPIEPDKMTLGAVGGFSVQLAPAAKKMAITEGIETGLSVMLATGLPTWAAISAGNIPKLTLPALPLAAEVIIFADNDENGCGQKFSRTAAMRWLAERRHVSIAMPPNAGEDFNDILCKGAA